MTETANPTASGGGDPLSHPDFAELVRGLRAKGLMPSVTVNGRHLARHMNLLRRRLSSVSLFVVGVSFYEQLSAWDYRHLVVHMIAGVYDPAVLDGATRRKTLLRHRKNTLERYASNVRLGQENRRPQRGQTAAGSTFGCVWVCWKKLIPIGVRRPPSL